MSTDFFIENACDNALCRLAVGDSEALTVIYDKLARRIFMLCLSILGNKQDAEDAMQQTFLKLMSSSNGYKRGTNSKAYILKTAQNISLNLLEKRKRESQLISPEDENIPFFDEENFRDLESLALLSEEERQIVVLKIECSMTHKQIASIVGLSTAACEKKYRRGLKKLESYYKPQKGEKKIYE